MDTCKEDEGIQQASKCIGDGPYDKINVCVVERKVNMFIPAKEVNIVNTLVLSKEQREHYEIIQIDQKTVDRVSLHSR